MKKYNLKKSLILIGGFALMFLFFLSKDSFLQAQEQTEEGNMDTSVLDVKDEESAMTIHSEAFQLTIKESQNQSIDDLVVIVNGTPYAFAPQDYVGNVLTLYLDDTITQSIELQSQNYHFVPALISLDATTRQGNYQVEAIANADQDVMEGAVVYGKDGIQKDVYENDETVTVAIAAMSQDYRLYYQIAGGKWITSDTDMFEVHAISKEAHEVSVAYYVDYPSSPDQGLDEDGIIEPIDPKYLTIKFAAVENDEHGDMDQSGDSDKDDDSFQDSDGNVYTKDDIACKIAEIGSADYEKYQRVIGYYDDFRGIDASHTKYYQAGLYAQDIQVQPNGMYELILPYPQQSTKTNEFVILQFKDGNTDHAVTLDYTLDEDGIHVQVDHVSVFVVGWKEKITGMVPDNELNNNSTVPENQYVNNAVKDTTGGVNTGNISDLNIWMVIVIISSFSISVILHRKFHKYYS